MITAAIEKLKKKAKERTRVRYIPGHAEGDHNHPDCMDGAISGFGSTAVFVKFDKHVGRFGWDGATPQPCSPEDLKVLA